MTHYSIIYERLLNKITDYNFIKYSKEELEKELNIKLQSACARFHNCSKLVNRNNEEQIFLDDLSDLEIEILTCLLLLEWISPMINNVQILKQALGSKDFQIYSQASHLKELRMLQSSINKDVQYLMTKYSYIGLKV